MKECAKITRKAQNTSRKYKNSCEIVDFFSSSLSLHV